MQTVEIGDLSIGDGHPPKIMSVLNMSDNSGYKPSVETRAERAAAMVDEELVPAGADIIDVGLQSANPKYETKPPEYELERLEEAANVLEHVESDVVFSLETRYAEVAEAGIQAGFDIINDVCGFADPEMKPTVEAYDVPVIKMASPPDLENPGALKTIDDVFEALSRDGFTDRTIIDPAFGGWYDGKTFEDNWEMFRRLSEFRAFGRPILTATNREDFLGDLADQPETENQLAVSLAAATLEVDRGAHVIRTHDTRETYDVVQVAHALSEERSVRSDGVTVAEYPDASRRELERYRTLSERTVGDADLGSATSFVVSDLPSEDVDVLLNAAEVTDVAAGATDGRVYLSGTRTAFVDFFDRLPTNTDALETVATSLRESLARADE
ncbi:dihydropteroate synthase [Halopiger goleimassiliensis]|uniref:dihydropteroate synthase n=1 Tax=Halopiger goleimassiliensis TaxID=1293048 RepID=UPI00067811A3|nr:dihydropteroate synthase [Halopiger goleimassiliensis]